MKNRKEIKTEELENANGGGGYGQIITCSNCGREYNVYSVDTRTNGSGCDAAHEAKCPQCGQWNEFEVQ